MSPSDAPASVASSSAAAHQHAQGAACPSCSQAMQALRLQNTPGQALEHEMGELFKVLGFCVGQPWRARGFATGDRLHEL